MPNDFQNKHVFITGSTGEIGSALVHGFHEEGAHVHLCGRDAKKLNSLQEQYRNSTLWTINLEDPHSVQGIAQKIAQEHTIDILINNAGMTEDSLAVRMKLEAWNRVLQVNLTSAFLLCQAFIPKMIRKKWGRILNIASVVGQTGNPGQANYVASKAALIGMTKTLALEYASRGITVNAIAPGYIQSAMTQKISEQSQEALLARIPCGTYGTSEDVAYAALFLANPRAKYITGTTLSVNGGMACL